MIGQKKNLEKIFQWKLNRSLPRFLLIIGDVGSGRFTLAKEISKIISCDVVVVGNSVEEVRQVIKNSYTVSNSTMYIFKNCEGMRKEAINALLKVTEEPPNNSYFVMTYLTKNNVLDTIISRSTQLIIDPYSREELKEYTSNEGLLKYCRNIGDVKYWEDLGEEQFNEFRSYVENLSYNLKNMFGTEVLQVSNFIKKKEWDYSKFVNVLYLTLPFNREILFCTAQCLKDMRRNGVRKDATLDLYLLNVKELLNNV